MATKPSTKASQLIPRPLHALVISSLLTSATWAEPGIPKQENWAQLPPHPRLFANAARLEAIEGQTDGISLKLRALLKHEVDRLAAPGPVDVPLRGFYFDAMRKVQVRILSMALDFRLTGSKRSLEIGRSELLRLAAMTKWENTPDFGHFLDVGEAALAAGIGFDWFYDELSADERERISQAIVRNAILPSLAVADTEGSWVRGDFNWTQVCHGGVAVAALAIAEREPELARRVVDRAVTHHDKVGASYGPDGAYAEGPSYWSFGTSYHVILIEALRSALGTSCGLETFPGFLRTGEYNNQMVGPTGADYNFSDYHAENLNEPVMLWFARENRDRSLASDELSDISRALEKIETGKNNRPGKNVVISRHLAFEILWWDPSVPAIKDTRRLHWTASGVLPLAVMRSAWDDPAASFIAVKGGTPNHSHAHMDVGSFILEADGVRWAVDLGTENYGKMRAAKIDLWNYSQDSSRWSCFRNGPEGHNILRFDNTYQNSAGKAEIRALSDDNGTMGNTVDLTSLYQGLVARVERTVRLHPDRTITIEDEWTAADRAVTASWQWLTQAKVTRNAGGVLLEQNGKSLTLRVTPAAAEIEVQDVSAPRSIQDSPNPGLSRIVIRTPTAANSSMKLRVQAVPGGGLKNR